jgi:hypothetical protein
MLDVDPFLTMLYVMVDACGQTSLPWEPHPGPQAARSRRAVRTLALVAHGQSWGSARGFSRDAPHHRRAALPQVPTREQGNRQGRPPPAARVALFLHLVALVAAQRCL